MDLNKTISIIEALDEKQTASFIKITDKKIAKTEMLNKRVLTSLTSIVNDDNSLKLYKILLTIIVSNDDEIGDYLRRQLIRRKVALEKERTETSPTRGELLNALPYTLLIFPFLKGKFDIKYKDGKVYIDINISFLSITSIMIWLLDIVEKIKNDRKELFFNIKGKNELSEKTKIHELIINQRLEEAIKMLLKYNQRYNELTLIYSRLKKIEDDERTGIFNYEDTNVERIRITKSVLEYTDKILNK